MIIGDTKKKINISKKTVVIKKSMETKEKPIKLKKIDDKNKAICCQEFNPKPWNEKEIKWSGKFFVKDTVLTIFHIPLNYKFIIEKNMKKIEVAKATQKNSFIIVDELSPFHSHIYISVTKPVTNCKDVKLSGQFLSRVFEGPNNQIKKYVKEMAQFVKLKGKETKKNYFFYPTCEKCSKEYGKNYTVILAEF